MRHSFRFTGIPVYLYYTTFSQIRQAFSWHGYKFLTRYGKAAAEKLRRPDHPMKLKIHFIFILQQLGHGGMIDSLRFLLKQSAQADSLTLIGSH